MESFENRFFRGFTASSLIFPAIEKLPFFTNKKDKDDKMSCNNNNGTGQNSFQIQTKNDKHFFFNGKRENVRYKSVDEAKCFRRHTKTI